MAHPNQATAVLVQSQSNNMPQQKFSSVGRQKVASGTRVKSNDASMLRNSANQPVNKQTSEGQQRKIVDQLSGNNSAKRKYNSKA